jgi:23S rRNA (guanosine2251-2'-O)-methyltransferase
MKSKPPRRPGSFQKAPPRAQKDAKKRFERKAEATQSGKKFRDKKRGEKPAEPRAAKGRDGGEAKKSYENKKSGPSPYRKNKSFSRNKEARGEKPAPRPAPRSAQQSAPHPAARTERGKTAAPAEVAAQPQARGRERGSVYGHHAVQAAWLNPEREIRALYITEPVLRDFQPFLARAAELGLKRPEPTVLDKREIERLLPEGAVSQGIALAGAPLPEIFLRDILIRAEGAEKSVLVMLDQVTDPHNVGAILRSACAFGAAGVIMHRRHAPELAGVLLKTACGAAEYLPVSYETNLGDALEKLVDAGYTALGLDERGARTLAEIDVPEKCVLVLGAEGDGIRQRIRETCHELVRLPTREPIASLNVSNAAAVALYALLGAQG